MRARPLGILALAGLLALVATAGHGAPARQAASEENLPIPPIPPDDPPQDIAAPVPDIDASGPRPAEQQGAALKPVLDSRPAPLPGGDPVPGTLYRADQEQKRQFIPNPGIRLVVPIQK